MVKLSFSKTAVVTLVVNVQQWSRARRSKSVILAVMIIPRSFTFVKYNFCPLRTDLRRSHDCCTREMVGDASRISRSCFV
jgi:hypothetical protein